jgi:hypothetical protein
MSATLVGAALPLCISRWDCTCRAINFAPRSTRPARIKNGIELSNLASQKSPLSTGFFRNQNENGNCDIAI